METIAIGLIQFYHLLAPDHATIDSKTTVNTYLKNLLFYIHQNFLVILQVMLSRMLKKQGNFWAENIQKMVDSKIHKKTANKTEAIQIQRVYMTNCQNIIRNITKSNP
jgi:hypothetical protein